MLKIGDFSRICQVTVKTLRYYDRLGLLQPARVDPFTRHRYYTMSQIPRLQRILALKEMGLSLDEIRQVLNEDLSTPEFEEMLRLKQGELRAEIEAAQSRLQRIDAYINHINQEVNMSEYEVSLKAIPAQHVLAIREEIASSDDIAPLFTEVAIALKSQHIKSTGAWIAIYHHDGFRDTDLDIEIAVPVAETVQEVVALDEGRQLEIKKLPAYELTATVIEKGHNENWSGSYTALGNFMEANQYEIDGAVREVYLTTPDDEAGWMIEIQFPVRKKSEAIPNAY